ncbi:MAG: histidine phosphatase family protein [Mariprofundus sp.]|nr:histidine phosphatase family protein [Mariprofundus sp.]
MKTLILIRHAKSGWDDLSASDYDRTLNSRGKGDAPKMGLTLNQRQLVPDLFLSSTAERARMSTTLMLEAMPYPLEKVAWRRELYLATTSKLMQTIRTVPDVVNTLALLAHNPGISDLAERLSGRAIGNMPTASVVLLTAEIESWSSAGCLWQLLDYNYPKQCSESLNQE